VSGSATMEPLPHVDRGAQRRGALGQANCCCARATMETGMAARRAGLQWGGEFALDATQGPAQRKAQQAFSTTIRRTTPST
jgi:hypothetical protein